MGDPGPANPTGTKGNSISSKGHRKVSSIPILLLQLLLAFFVFSIFYCFLPFLSELSSSFLTSPSTFTTEDSVPIIEQPWTGPASTNRFQPPALTLLLFWPGLVVLHFAYRLWSSTSQIVHLIAISKTNTNRRNPSPRDKTRTGRPEKKAGKTKRQKKMTSINTKTGYSDESKLATSTTPVAPTNGLHYDDDSDSRRSSTDSERLRTVQMMRDLERNGKPRRIWHSVYARLWFFLATMITLIICYYAAETALLNYSARAGSKDLDFLLERWEEPTASWYPRNFTADVLPKPIHSHNDYWRRVPLYLGIKYGCVSTEADVWLINDELYVGHDRSSLNRKRTLNSLYVNPLNEILKIMNPIENDFANYTNNGIFEVDPDQTLFFFIDLKTAGVPTFYKTIEQLKPLLDQNRLTTFENGKIIYRPVTVILTGNSPFEEIIKNTTYRYYFHDAPITELDTGLYDNTTSIFANGNFQKAVGGKSYPYTFKHGFLKDEEKKRLKEQLDEAHKRGLSVRYWNVPFWPIGWRNGIWKEVVHAGVDLLSVDDIRAASKASW